jgi:hypothetical protein
MGNPPRTVAARTFGACEKCGGMVGIRPDGSLFPHTRFIDGGGFLNGQDHTQVPCEGRKPKATER